MYHVDNILSELKLKRTLLYSKKMSDTEKFSDLIVQN